MSYSMGQRLSLSSSHAPALNYFTLKLQFVCMVSFKHSEEFRYQSLQMQKPPIGDGVVFTYGCA